jgi:hypothetical protein
MRGRVGHHRRSCLATTGGDLETVALVTFLIGTAINVLGMGKVRRDWIGSVRLPQNVLCSFGADQALLDSLSPFLLAALLTNCKSASTMSSHQDR